MKEEDYRKLVIQNNCRWCGALLPQKISSYDHPNGQDVEGYSQKQWLFIKCDKCGYSWSLWKLGVKLDG